MTENGSQGTRRKAHLVVASATAGVFVLAIGVQAQEAGTLATFGLSFGGQYTDNDPDPDDSRFTTGLNFNLQSVTRTQSFGLSADGQILLDENGSGFDNPRIMLDYTRETRSTALSLGASYRIQDVDGELEVLDPLTLSVIDFIEDDGTRETFGVNAGLQTGLDAHFGTDTRLSYSNRRYSGTADPGLTDLDTWQASTALRFDISPRITLRTSASYLETDEEGGENTNRRTTRGGISADLILDPLWSASVGLQYSVIETDRDDGFGGRILTEQDGAGFSVSLTRQFQTGTLGFSLSRQIAENGAEDSFRISRDTRLANEGTLAWSLGLVSFENGDTSPIASLAYSRPTSRGTFAVNLQQTTAVDDDDLSVLRTVLGANYNQTINNTSSWSLDGSLASVDVVGSDAGDQQRAEIGVGYNHALTADWGLSARVRHRVNYVGGEEDSSANILSLSLARSFSFRP